MELDLLEGVSEKEIFALKSLAESLAGQGSMFVNVGVWKGHTTSALAEVAKSCCGHVYAVDHWKGAPGSGQEQMAKDYDIFSIFKINMMALGLADYIIPISKDSVIASQDFADKSIDLVFLDSDHIYNNFKKELAAWIPKIKVGGIICGHDCEAYYGKGSLGLQVRLDNNLDIDFEGLYHAGVIKGLYEYFNDDYIIIPETRIWYKVIE